MLSVHFCYIATAALGNTSLFPHLSGSSVFENQYCDRIAVLLLQRLFWLNVRNVVKVVLCYNHSLCCCSYDRTSYT